MPVGRLTPGLTPSPISASHSVAVGSYSACVAIAMRIEAGTVMGSARTTTHEITCQPRMCRVTTAPSTKHVEENSTAPSTIRSATRSPPSAPPRLSANATSAAVPSDAAHQNWRETRS